MAFHEEVSEKLKTDYRNKTQQECVVLAVWSEDTEYVIHAYNPVWGEFDITKLTFSLKPYEKGLKAGSKILCTKKDNCYILDKNIDYESLKQEFNTYYNTKMNYVVHQKINEKIH